MYRNATVKNLRSLIISNGMKVVRTIRMKIKNIRTAKKKLGALNKDACYCAHQKYQLVQPFPGADIAYLQV